MGPMPLTEVKFIRTFLRDEPVDMTVEEVLKHATDPDFRLDHDVSGMEFMSVVRLLSHIGARMLQKDDSLKEGDREDPLPNELIAETLAELEADQPLYGGEQNFFQIPDAKVLDGGVRKPVSVLSPTAPGNNSQAYWSRDKYKPVTLPKEEALRCMLIFSMYSLVGNGKLEDRRQRNGSPGVRCPKAKNTITEMFVKSQTLWSSLLCSIPLTWIEGEGMPAWADPKGEKSKTDMGMHPLWLASWTPNGIVGYWEGENLVAVKVGGVPSERLGPFHELMGDPWGQGDILERYKKWIAQRDEEDPFRLYVRDSKGILRAKRLDLSKDLIQLAVEWANELTVRDLESQFAERVWVPDFIDDSLLFARHQIAGNNFTLLIRDSVVTGTKESLWCLNPDEKIQTRIINQAKFIDTLKQRVCAPFCRQSDKDHPTFDDLADLRPMMETEFWRRITPVYEEVISTAQAADFEAVELNKKGVDATIAALEAVIKPYLLQNPKRNINVQKRTICSLRALLPKDKKGQ